MKKFVTHLILLAALALTNLSGAEAKMEIKTDKYPAAKGELTIGFVGHGSLYVAYDSRVYHFDPFSKAADYSTLPRADVILITHAHSDHLDLKAIEAVKKSDTVIIAAGVCSALLPTARIISNGARLSLAGADIEAVPAYNLVHKRSDGSPFHPKGEGNGYVLSLGGKRLYVAGDTENVPEMKSLKNIDIAFLPMNLPYTMTPDMTAAAAMSFRPKVLYPYHFGETDTKLLVDLLKDEKDIKVVVREMK